MMGRTHVLTGMAAGAAALPLVPAGGMVEQLAWVSVVAGSAMLPDLDHRSATVTNMWGPISGVMHKAVAWAGRGHRGGAHDFIVAPLVFGLLAWLASHHPISSGVAVAIAAGLAIRALEFVIPGRTAESAVVNMALSMGAAWAAVHYGLALPWLPYAVGLGVLIHIFGDAVTRTGVPRPFSWIDGDSDRNQGVLTTGRWYETWLITPALGVAIVVLVYLHVPTIGTVVNDSVSQARTTIGVYLGGSDEG